MKRFIAVLSGLLVMPAFAEVAPVYYDDVIEYSGAEMYDGADVYDDDTVAEQEVTSTATPNIPLRNATRATRTVPSVSTSGLTTRESANRNSRAVASRTAANRATANISQTRNAMTRGTASRAATVRSASSQGISARRAATRAATTARAGAASIIQTDTVNTPLYTGRVGARTITGTAVSSRVPAVRVASTATVGDTASTVSVADMTTSMDELAQITDFCKAQYTECMDNFCNVLDESQGRCSCSKNIKNYAKTEQALKEANENLQGIAQQIQYIGLSGDNIETLFEQTQAEIALQGSSDSSQMKTNLDKIKNMIVDVKSGTASSGEVSGISLNLDGLLNFSFDSAGVDLATLFGSTTTNTSSISNQRGEELYKTATARCKAAVLNDCVAKGVDAAVITNSYDLEIDKQCLVYERTLTQANDQMKTTVRNAQTVLQNARLMVAQNKNTYELRGCVNALDSCMQDDFVCGTEYEGCLDPTGKYIVNGALVSGAAPLGNTAGEIDSCRTSGLYKAWTYGGKNAWCDGGNLSGYIEDTIASTPDDTMTKFLVDKIGYHDNDDGKNHGMCISVLNQCQNYTYSDGEYQKDNAVIREYLQRTLTQIKVAQDEIIAKAAESCLDDVSSCLTQNGYVNGGGAKNNVAINSCRASIVTCMSVNGMAADNTGIEGLQEWISGMLNTSTSTACDPGFVPVYDTTSDSVTYTCKPQGNPCDGNGYYNYGTRICETIFSPDNKTCDADGGDKYLAGTNTCTCTDTTAKFMKAADGQSAACCKSGEFVENGACKAKATTATE